MLQQNFPNLNDSQLFQALLARCRAELNNVENPKFGFVKCILL